MVLVVGCGGGGDPSSTGAAGTGGGAGGPPAPLCLPWNISFAGGFWYCNGAMNTCQTNVGNTTRVTGSWNCSGINTGDASPVTMGGSMSGSVSRATYALDYLMMTSATQGFHVTGTLSSGGIIGTAHFSDAEVPFTAQ